MLTCMTHLLALFTAYHCYTCLNDLISWPLYFYYEKTALKCVPSKMKMYPQMETPEGTCTPKQKYKWACCSSSGGNVVKYFLSRALAINYSGGYYEGEFCEIILNSYQ